MKTLGKKFEFKVGRVSQSTIDWAKLLDGGTYQITQGEDFEGKVRNMAGRIKFKAALRGQTVLVNVVGEDGKPATDGTSIAVRVTSEPDAEKGATYKAHQKELQAARKAKGEATPEGEEEVTEG